MRRIKLIQSGSDSNIEKKIKKFDKIFRSKLEANIASRNISLNTLQNTVVAVNDSGVNQILDAFIDSLEEAKFPVVRVKKPMKRLRETAQPEKTVHEKDRAKTNTISSCVEYLKEQLIKITPLPEIDERKCIKEAINHILTTSKYNEWASNPKPDPTRVDAIYHEYTNDTRTNEWDLVLYKGKNQTLASEIKTFTFSRSDITTVVKRTQTRNVNQDKEDNTIFLPIYTKLIFDLAIFSIHSPKENSKLIKHFKSLFIEEMKTLQESGGVEIYKRNSLQYFRPLHKEGGEYLLYIFKYSLSQATKKTKINLKHD